MGPFAHGNLPLGGLRREGDRSRRFAGSNLRAVTGRIAKIACDGLLDRFAGSQQPQNDEQRHHRCQEIGIRRFPGAPVMSGVHNLFLDDDRLHRQRIGFLLGHGTIAAEPWLCMPPPTLGKRAALPRNRTPAKFYRHRRRAALQEGNQLYADDVQEMPSSSAALPILEATGPSSP